MAATVEDLVVQGLARCAEYGNDFPETRSVLYRRLGVRQQQLYAAAARANPEYFGAAAIGTLDGSGRISLATMGDPGAADPTPNMELVSEIVVSAASGAPGVPAVGALVHVVALTDPDAELPPRVTVRGGTIAPVGTDLAGVTQITVYYSHRPFGLRPQDGAVAVELPEPFHDLLVLDLARFLVRKMTTLSAEVRQAALQVFEAEEQEAMANFVATVQGFTSAVERGRFARTQGNTRQ